MIPADVPTFLELVGLQWNDGKHPDGIIMVPWICGRHMVWDVTTPDTIAPSYIMSATNDIGAVEALTEEGKNPKNISTVASYSFSPIAIETSGAVGPQMAEFLHELGNYLFGFTSEEKAHTCIYLLQRVQRGNAASNLGFT